jgi:hypothetical protein
MTTEPKPSATAPDITAADASNALADLAGIGHLLLDLSKRDEDDCDMHPRTLYFLADSIFRLVRTVEGHAFPANAALRSAKA